MIDVVLEIMENGVVFGVDRGRERSPMEAGTGVEVAMMAALTETGTCLPAASSGLVKSRTIDGYDDDDVVVFDVDGGMGE